MPSIVPSIPVMLDRERHLRFSNRAIFACERELSKLWGEKVSIFSLFTNVDRIGMNDIGVLAWQGLLHEDPTLTFAQVQDMMDFEKAGDILGAVLQAWNAATAPAEPAPAGGEEGSDPLAPTPTGPPTGALVGSALA